MTISENPTSFNGIMIHRGDDAKKVEGTNGRTFWINHRKKNYNFSTRLYEHLT